MSEFNKQHHGSLSFNDNTSDEDVQGCLTFFAIISIVATGFMSYFGGTNEIMWLSIAGIVIGVLNILGSGIVGIIASTLIFGVVFVFEDRFLGTNAFFMWLLGNGVHNVFFFARIMLVCCFELLIVRIINRNQSD